jgi:hypothetical protein
MPLLPHTCGMNIAKIASININGIYGQMGGDVY